MEGMVFPVKGLRVEERTTLRRPELWEQVLMPTQDVSVIAKTY